MLARNDDNNLPAKPVKPGKPGVNFKGVSLNENFARKLFADFPSDGWIVETQYFSSNQELALFLAANLKRGFKHLYLFNMTHETYETAFHPLIKPGLQVRALGLDSLSYETVKLICQNLPDNLVRISIENLDQDFKDDDGKNRRLKNRSLALLYKTLTTKTLATNRVIEVICGSNMPTIWLNKFTDYNASSVAAQTSTAMIMAQTATPAQNIQNNSLKRTLPPAINPRPTKIASSETANDNTSAIAQINYSLREIASFTQKIALAKQTIETLKNQIQAVDAKLAHEIYAYAGTDLIAIASQTTPNPVSSAAYNEAQQYVVHYGSENFQKSMLNFTPEQANNYLTNYSNTVVIVRRYLKYELISSEEMIAALQQKLAILHTELDEVTSFNLYSVPTAYTVATEQNSEVEYIHSFRR